MPISVGDDSLDWERRSAISGGQCQRTAIATALIGEFPRAHFFDESAPS